MFKKENPEMQTKILLVDDHAILRKGLQLLLEKHEDLEVVGEAGDGEAGIALIRKLSPDVVIMDITMPGLNGIEATRRIVTDFPATKVIALSIHSEKKFVEDMLQAGAAGYILKESVPEDLVRGIRAVTCGEGYLSPSITGIVVSGYRETLSQNHNLAQPENEILFSKLHQPDLPANHVQRQRLLDVLDDNCQLPLQIISAPAGYGKSTLASSWLKTNNGPSAWLAIDENDNDLNQFLLYFSRAVQNLFLDSLPKASAMLGNPKLPPIQMIAKLLVNEIEEIIHCFVLVLDDFHLIKEKSVHDLLSAVLRHPPRNMHLLVIGRRDPFLPTITLRAQKKVNEIRLHELRFSESETGEFFQKSLKKEFVAVNIKSWTKKTEGWITGLHLAALSAAHQGDLPAVLDKIQPGSQYIMEYLFSEILTQQDPLIIKYLMRTSILNRFCGPLCESVCWPDLDTKENHISGWDFIHKLQDENMFMISIDEQKYWFRYHHLFQELLQQQLARKLSAKEIADIHLRASAWFEGQNLIEEAINHAIKAEEMVGAAEIFERHRHAEQDKDGWRNIERWLALFPTEKRTERPKLLLAQAWVSHNRYQLQEIIPIIKRIELLRGSDTSDKNWDEVSSGELKFFRGVLQYWEGKAESSFGLCQEARELIPQKHSRIAGLIEIYCAIASHMAGQGQMAHQTLSDKIIGGDFLSRAFISRLYMARAFLYTLSGNLPQVLQDARSIQDIVRNEDLTYSESWGGYLEATSSFRAGEWDLALSQLAQMVDSRYSMHTRAAIDAMVALALTYQDLNRPDAASKTMTLLLAFALETGDAQHLVVVRSAQARLALMQDDLESASQWLWSFTGKLFTPSMFIWLEIPSITKARVLVATGSDESLRQAGELLETLYKEVEEQHNYCQWIEAMPLLALVYNKQGRVDEALIVLKKAVDFAKPGGWMRPFVEPGSALVDLLKQLVERKIETDYTEKILAALTVKEPGPQSGPSSLAAKPLTATKNQPLIDPLTNREIEVLILLKQRLSNQEISDKLFISTETVKSHLKNIYAKLEVGKRREAVDKADRLDLLDS